MRAKRPCSVALLHAPVLNARACLLNRHEHTHTRTYAQFGNTCYCNSVMQALYFCMPFREAVLEWARAPNVHSSIKNDEESMLFSVAETFSYINNHKKKFGVYGPKRLIQVLP
jgi:ubiquitin C-terminal hydrolase